jgi:hypothetical protein
MVNWYASSPSYRNDRRSVYERNDLRLIGSRRDDVDGMTPRREGFVRTDVLPYALGPGGSLVGSNNASVGTGSGSHRPGRWLGCTDRTGGGYHDRTNDPFHQGLYRRKKLGSVAGAPPVRRRLLWRKVVVVGYVGGVFVVIGVVIFGVVVVVLVVLFFFLLLLGCKSVCHVFM